MLKHLLLQREGEKHAVTFFYQNVSKRSCVNRAHLSPHTYTACVEWCGTGHEIWSTVGVIPEVHTGAPDTHHTTRMGQEDRVMKEDKEQIVKQFPNSALTFQTPSSADIVLHGHILH